MDDEDQKGTPKDRHYARLRRARRDQRGGPVRRAKTAFDGETVPDGVVRLYGLHTVRAAIANPRRVIHSLKATRNALRRLDIETPDALPFKVEITDPRSLDRLVGSEAVHQGAIADARPLEPRRLDSLGDAKLLLVLDQVTDPHNVGAIMRSAVAFNADALVTTARHSPAETGTLAKAASGALEHIDLIEVRNLAVVLSEIARQGFQTIGLDSDGPRALEETISRRKVALVVGAEGKGLRQKTRETVTDLARLDMPGAIRSLNVSNAAAIALYVTQRKSGSKS